MIPPPPISPDILALIQAAVREDLGPTAYSTLHGDRTVEVSIPPDMTSTATIVARAPGIISGTFLISAILAQYDPALRCEIISHDGGRVAPQTPIATITGPTRGLLSAERVLLNFLCHLSGIATLTRRYVDAVASAPKRIQLCDTRKTTPGFRRLDKYAVMTGGGVNHRMGLFDGVMLKDNHLAALRATLGQNLTLAQLTAQVRAQVPQGIPVWLEVDTLDQLKSALPGGGADIILLDNMTPDQLTQAVALRNAHHPVLPQLEASGGITLQNIAAIAQTGVERISIGALTHSAPILDLSLELA